MYLFSKTSYHDCASARSHIIINVSVSLKAPRRSAGFATIRRNQLNVSRGKPEHKAAAPLPRTFPTLQVAAADMRRINSALSRRWRWSERRWRGPTLSQAPADEKKVSAAGRYYIQILSACKDLSPLQKQTVIKTAWIGQAWPSTTMTSASLYWTFQNK